MELSIRVAKAFYKVFAAALERFCHEEGRFCETSCF